MTGIRSCFARGVYNFALFHDTGDFNVLFETIQVDETGAEVGERETVGAARTSIGARHDLTDLPMQEVCVSWDTTGLSSIQNGFRFYVTVDPDDEVNPEIHEWKDASGKKLAHGNNEGYWRWGTGVHVLKPDDTLEADGRKITIEWDAPAPGPVAACAGREYTLKARIRSNGDSPRFHYVVFSDGPPSEGRIIATRQASVIEGESFVHARWRPDGTGDRKLYVHIMQTSDTPSGDEDTDVLAVSVFPSGGPASWQDWITYDLLPKL